MFYVESCLSSVSKPSLIDAETLRAIQFQFLNKSEICTFFVNCSHELENYIGLSNLEGLFSV